MYFLFSSWNKNYVNLALNVHLYSFCAQYWSHWPRAQKIRTMVTKKNCIQETLTLSTCADISIVSKTKQKMWVRFWTPPHFKALCGDDTEQNAGTIHASNPEHLPDFKAPTRGQSGTECGNDPRVQSGKPTCF